MLHGNTTNDKGGQIKILVTGASGQLGQEIVRISGRFPQFSVIGLSRSELDVTDPVAVKRAIESAGCDFVINCAAYTAVDAAESNPGQCRSINVDGVRNIVNSLINTNVRLIHISTDYVFDGEATTPYSESDATNPLSVYGKSKLDSETTALTLLPEAMIIRTGWLYGAKGRNFYNTILKFAHDDKTINVVNDQKGTPTLVTDLAEAILNIIGSGKWLPGVYHYSNLGEATWYEFAKAIVEESQIDVVMRPVSTEEYGAEAVRPRYSVLDKAKITKTYGIEIADWRDALRRCIARKI